MIRRRFENSRDGTCGTVIRKTKNLPQLSLLPGEKVRMKASVQTKPIPPTVQPRIPKRCVHLPWIATVLPLNTTAPLWDTIPFPDGSSIDQHRLFSSPDAISGEVGRKHEVFCFRNVLFCAK